MREVKDMENFLIQAAYDEKAVETESAREITASGVPLVIPAEYLGMERMEGDPEDAEIYGFNGEESDGVAFFSLIPREDALPFGDVDSVIENVHEILEETQGLIRVGSGSTASGRPFIYTIIKNVTEEGVLQYTRFRSRSKTGLSTCRDSLTKPGTGRSVSARSTAFGEFSQSPGQRILTIRHLPGAA